MQADAISKCGIDEIGDGASMERGSLSWSSPSSRLLITPTFFSAFPFHYSRGSLRSNISTLTKPCLRARSTRGCRSTKFKSPLHNLAIVTLLPRVYQDIFASRSSCLEEWLLLFDLDYPTEAHGAWRTASSSPPFSVLPSMHPEDTG
eukprot:1546176-Pleurochrysis_carterae.AAC.1